jgi:hypothetical protein
MNIGFFALSLALAATTGPSPAWLDARVPANWNVSGAAIAAAPAGGRCASTVRPAAGSADRAVAGRGWLVARVVPALPSAMNAGGWTVVMGISGADGMCRPVGYQLFAFHGGAFVGTLSPQRMDSRTDGSFVALRPSGPNTLQVDFVRYADQDPLCCPHATTRVSYAIANGVGAVVKPIASRTMPNSG